MSEFGVGQGKRRWVPDLWSQGVPLLEGIWSLVTYLKIHGPDHLRWFSCADVRNQGRFPEPG